MSKGTINPSHKLEEHMETKSKFLHGTLEVTIFHATRCKSTPLNCLTSNGKPTYVTIKLDDHTVAETSHERDRVWNQTFQILCAHPLSSTITITMKTKCSLLGKIHFTAHQLVNDSSFISGFFPLHLEDPKKPNEKLKLQFIVWFKPAQFESTWQNLINHSSFKGLRNSTYPERSNCEVILYHDAHHNPSFNPPFSIGSPKSPRRLWEDVYRAIEGAKHLIYIVGWSLNPDLVLVRDSETDVPHGKGVSLGELLKRKAEEGVAVRVMLWDDETSIALIKNKGLMRTHDEDAFAYFRHTKVVCRLCPRSHNNFPTFFTHHQKTVTVDTRMKDYPVNSREIMSFVGGIDLCDGRYDTEEHSLFHTLATKADCNNFYQSCIEGVNLGKGGPRLPWHDTHACVTGEAAFDILRNFEQRWIKQCDPSLLIPTSTISNLIQQPSIPGTSPDRKWKVQVFRSIDHFSASPLIAGAETEQSIHEAYVDAIRRADRFIYIENQYFMGGCGLWEKDQHCGCRNLIPIEIALKVANKIRARERFAVYILIPMWPEGLPESESVQDILHWTRETMAMMYNLIGEAIKETGEKSHPRDYLNFFCLSNREKEIAGEYVPHSSPQPSSQYWNTQKARRFMIYVHSKLMIVDDIYILIGSANINQRSMDGTRDTEIAIGCYHAEDSENEHNQDISTYRRSLWYEHMGRIEESYHNPESIECVERLRLIGDEMWEIYSREEVVDMEGVHWVSYPVNVSENGSVMDISGFDHFPDTQAPVKGKRSKILPAILTT